MFKLQKLKWSSINQAGEITEKKKKWNPMVVLNAATHARARAQTHIRTNRNTQAEREKEIRQTQLDPLTFTDASRDVMDSTT